MLLQLPDHSPFLQLVDLDHGGQQLEVIARVARELLEGGDIFWKAGAAVSNPRLQKMSADPMVQAHTAGHLEDVRAGLLADVRDLVDERDLRGQERVRRELDHLCTSDVGAHKGRTEWRVQLDHRVPGPVTLIPDDHAIGVEEVL